MYNWRAVHSSMTLTAVNRTALITGASSGIGLELAKLFAADKYNLILVARDMPALQRVAKELSAAHSVECTVIALDLSAVGAAEKLAKQLGKQRIDVLVNNAGFGAAGPFAQADLANAEAMIAVNVTALTALTRLYLPQMIARKQGKILNVASTAAFLPGPNMAVYYATKSYVLSFSQAISEETVGSGVTVTALCPGPTQTGFEKRAKTEHLPAFAKSGLATSQAVARIGYIGMQCGKRIVVPGTRNKFMTFMTRFIPRSTQARIVKKVQTK